MIEKLNFNLEDPTLKFNESSFTAARRVAAGAAIILTLNTPFLDSNKAPPAPPEVSDSPIIFRVADIPSRVNFAKLTARQEIPVTTPTPPVPESSNIVAPSQDNNQKDNSQKTDIVAAAVVIPTPAPIVEVSKKIEATVKIATTEYGQSGLGRSLKVVSLKPQEIKSTVLVTFEIHGYEDAYPKDGQVLINTANQLIEHFSNHPQDLGTTALYIVPSANPDGLIDGSTNNGAGRCQVSEGVDINRDFDYNWISRDNDRNRTTAPFSAPESRALRDLVLKLNPSDVIDVHGWLGTTYGTSSLCQYFQNTLGVGRQSGLGGVSGYFTSWAINHAARTALIELPSPQTDPQKTVNAFIKLLANK